MAKLKKYEKKFKRSFIYYQVGKRFEEELTYERFVKELESGYMEFDFFYKNIDIYIAYHYVGSKQIYELNLVYNDGKTIFNEYDSPKELLKNGLIEGHSIKDLWEDLQN